MGITTVLLIVASVSVFTLFLGATIRPKLDDLLDRLGNTLRIDLHGERKLALHLPEAISVRWEDQEFRRIYQQEFGIVNRTRQIFTDVAIRLTFVPSSKPDADMPVFFGALIMPTADAEGRFELTGDPCIRLLRLDYLVADSEIGIRVFSSVDGTLNFESACGKRLTIRRSAALVAETAQRVLPQGVLKLKPLLLPLALFGILSRPARK